jgi:hypothetical protein
VTESSEAPVATAHLLLEPRAPPPQPTAPDPIPQAAARTVRVPCSAERGARPKSRRKRDVAGFLERREEKLSVASEEAKERIARLRVGRGGARRADGARPPRGLPLAAAPRTAVRGDRFPADPGDRGGGTACLTRRGRRRGENVAPSTGPGHRAGGHHRQRDHRPGAAGDDPQPARRAQRAHPQGPPAVLALAADTPARQPRREEAQATNTTTTTEGRPDNTGGRPHPARRRATPRKGRAPHSNRGDCDRGRGRCWSRWR